jgi:hypothetical protein
MFDSPKRKSVARSIAKQMVRAAIAVCALQLITLSIAFAQSQSLGSAPMIFDVRRSLPLEPDEPVYHDFYINAGPEAGFKKGMYITVVRLVPVHDPVQNKQQAELAVNVARLQVIHVAHALTVARLHSEFTDEERPTLEYESVMIGDRIDTGSLTMDAPGAKKKLKAFIAPAPKRQEASIQSPTARAEKVEAPVSVPVSVPVPGPSDAPKVNPKTQLDPQPSSVKSTNNEAESGITFTAQKNASPDSGAPDMVRSLLAPGSPQQSL